MDANSKKIKDISSENTKDGKLILFNVIQKQKMHSEYNFEDLEYFKMNLGKTFATLLNHKLSDV